MTPAAHRSPPAAVRTRARFLRPALAVAVVSAAALFFGPAASAATAVARSSVAVSVRVSGNQLVDASGKSIRLIGVDHSGSESACVDGEGFFDPPNSDTPGMIAAMQSWHADAVRVPLNEDCWLGINLPYPQLGGAAYQSAIVNYVNDLNAAGLVVILDLHWSAPGSETAGGGAVMADEDHAPNFWLSVASAFKGHQGVVFDLYNEPRDLPFSCLVHGGCVAGGFQVAGYDQLIDDVRSTGATNVIMVAGTAFAADPLGFGSDLPDDPIGQLAISVHVYNFNAAKSPKTWDQWLPLVHKLPFVTGELGEKDCTSNFIDAYMPWADAHNVSYMAWSFNAGPSWPCNAPSLVTDYNGDPTPYGAGYKAHLAALGLPAFADLIVAAPGVTSLLPSLSGDGYAEITRDGGVIPFGDAIDFGSMAESRLSRPVVSAAATPDGGGYWLVASDGGIFTFGDAAYYGSTGAIHLNQPVVGMASTPDGGGYWLVASDGGIFTFGDAAYDGSTGAIHLNQPVVGMASTPDGGGYWLVASDGGIFTFGDAAYDGSTGAIHLNQPVVGMASTPDGGGYWLVASDGGIFTFGDAAYYGSTGATRLNQPVVGMASTPDGGGYWLVASDGGIFTFGDAAFVGSAPAL